MKKLLFLALVLACSQGVQLQAAAAPLTVVVVTAEWCPHCKQFKPVVKDLQAQMTNVSFEFLDADKDPRGKELAPRTVPVVKMYKNGVEVESINGSVSKGALKSKIQSHM